MRIHIMGAPGSGKTTLAKAVGEGFGVPVWDLDFVVYDRETGSERVPEDLQYQLRLVLESAARVTEGAYHQGEWLASLLEAADLVVWLDMPWRVCAMRMIGRHVRLTLAGTNPHPGTVRFLRFLNYTRGAKPLIDSSTSELLAPLQGKVVRCKSNRDIETAWARMEELNLG